MKNKMDKIRKCLKMFFFKNAISFKYDLTLIPFETTMKEIRNWKRLCFYSLEIIVIVAHVKYFERNYIKISRVEIISKILNSVKNNMIAWHSFVQ